MVPRPRGAIAVKGKGVMQTHFLLREGDEMSEDELRGPASPERSFITSGASAGASVT